MGQPLRGFTVLVVEDDVDTLSVAAVLLAEVLGCDVLRAATGGDALRVIKSGAEIDLVFSDVAMPDIDGLTLARTIQQQLPDVPIVLTTGYPDMLDAITEAGAIAVEKPYTIERLENVFSQRLERNRPPSPHVVGAA